MGIKARGRYGGTRGADSPSGPSSCVHRRDEETIKTREEIDRASEKESTERVGVSIRQCPSLSPFLSVSHSFSAASSVLVPRPLCTCRYLFVDLSLSLSFFLTSSIAVYFSSFSLSPSALALGNSQAIHPRMHEMTMMMMMMPGTLAAATCRLRTIAAFPFACASYLERKNA